MEKILKQMENDTVITNPKEPVKTFFRKIRYRIACVVDWIRKIIFRHHKENKTTRDWYLFILIFVVFRSIGKLSGAVIGGKLSKSSSSVQKFTAGGLIPLSMKF